MEQLTEAMESSKIDKKYYAKDLHALITGANIIYSNAEIRNLTEYKTNGQEFDIRISSSDQVIDLGDSRFCFRLKMPCPSSTLPATGISDPWMYNLPDVVSLFEVQSCTLDNTSLIYTNRVNRNMNIRRAIMSRVKRYDPECDPMQNKIQLAQQTLAISQEIENPATTNPTFLGTSGGLIASTTTVGVLPTSAVGLDTSSALTLSAGLDKTSVKCIDKLNELFCERGVFTDTQTGNTTADPTKSNITDNLSLTAILSDSKKRIAQASRQYNRCNNLFGIAAAAGEGTPEKIKYAGVEKFYPMGNQVADGSISQDETGNYYSVRLGDLVPELNSLTNFYMNGHTLTLRFKINQQSECISQIAKPLTSTTFKQLSIAPTAAQVVAKSTYDDLGFKTLTEIIPTVCQPYLKMNFLNINDSDRQAYKMIQNKLPIPIKSYNQSSGIVTNSGQWFWQESFSCSSVQGVMICFTAANKPTGGNFNLSGVETPSEVTQRISKCIDATDFTKDSYDQNMARGPMWNHDHFYLPVYQVRVQVKNVIYKSNNPPISQLALQQWMAAQDSSKLLLGDGRFYDVSFQEYIANKCVWFVPMGLNYSGVDIRDQSLIQTTVVFTQDQGYSPPFKRTIANKFQGNIIYCCSGNIRFDRGYTEVV